jgi:hypothetical protein
MTEDEKLQFVKRQSQRVSEVLGKKPTPLRGIAIKLCAASFTLRLCGGERKFS